MTARAIEFRAVDAIIARLEETGIYREVLGALDVAALSSWPRTPAAFVLPVAEDATDSVAPAIQATQHTTATIGVQTLLSAPNDRTGGRTRDEPFRGPGRLARGARRLDAGGRPRGVAVPPRLSDRH